MIRRLAQCAALLTALALSTGLAWAQLKPRVTEIQRARQSYINEVVEIRGFVTQLGEEATSTRFFFLKDDWGGIIKVRTSREVPEVGRRYAITGPVGQDPRTLDLYLSEESRVALDSTASGAPGVMTGAPVGAAPAGGGVATAPAAASEPAAVDLAPRPWWENKGLLAVAIALGLLFVGIVIALVVLLTGRKKTRPRTSDFTMAASLPVEPAPAPQQVIEGRTIKMHAPPPGTLKLLPGWLEVTAGDETVKEIRFYRLKGEAAAETTFGRASGRPYVHIQLKPMTVSSRQAKIAFDGATPKLTNYASNESNPTRHNGRDLGVNESVVLGESDSVEMGEVHFKFHAG